MESPALDAALGDSMRVFLDSSVCIAYHSTVEPVHPLARHLFRRIADSGDPITGYISTLTATELLVRPVRSGGPDLSFMHTFLRGFPNLNVLPVDLDVALEAANVRAVSRLPVPDSLVIATALLSGCEAILTNDRDWARRLASHFGRFRWIYLGALATS